MYFLNYFEMVPVAHIIIGMKLCVQYWTPDNGQRDCPKHVDFHSKNKFEKLVHLVGFVIRIDRICLSEYRYLHTYTTYRVS